MIKRQQEFSRSSRLNAEISRHIAMIIQTKLKDPRLGMVMVNYCKVSCDLSNAKIYVSFIENRESIDFKMSLLNKANGYIRHCLAKKAQLRIIPMLHFHYDEQNAHQIKLNELIDNAKKS